MIANIVGSEVQQEVFALLGLVEEMPQSDLRDFLGCVAHELLLGHTVSVGAAAI